MGQAASSSPESKIYVMSGPKETKCSDLVLKNELVALVADTSEATRFYHRTYLNTLGVECWEVESGLEVLELCELRLIKFDLILMAYDLPVHNGPETTRLLHGMGICPAIVGVTAQDLGREIQTFMDAGIADFFEKPLTRSDFISILRLADDLK